MLHSYQKAESSSGSRSSVLLDSFYKYVKYPDKVLDRVVPVLREHANTRRRELLEQIRNREYSRVDLEEILRHIEWRNNFFLAVIIASAKTDRYRPHRDPEIGKKIRILHEMYLKVNNDFYVPEQEHHRLVEDAIRNRYPISNYSNILTTFTYEGIQKIHKIYRGFFDSKTNLAEEMIGKIILGIIDLSMEKPDVLDRDYNELYNRIKQLKERALMLENIMHVVGDFLSK